MDNKKIALISVLFLAAVSACSTQQKEVPFKYGMIIQKAFGELGDGREIPVTIEKATEIDGSVTDDGKYLFFSSDRDRGNFDIYLRSMTDITTVRVTSHPAKDSSPAVSANGKYLAFVSTREDPQGDIYVMKINPKSMIDDFASDPDKSYDDDAVNISALTDPVSRAPLSVKDADPSFSPDGRTVVFSSSRGGSVENLWACTRKGKDLRQLTTKGGIHPRFSQDGSRIVFVSYRDNPQGDIYSIDTVTAKESRVTSMAGLKLYPSFMGTNDDIIFTLLDRDTNGDGIIDFHDMSVLCRYNAVKKSSYPLTLYSSSSFRGRWFPVFPQKYQNSQEDNFKGVIFYSAQSGENININVLPEYGIIPKRKNVYDQLSLSESYLREEGDREKYLLALMRVYYYFGGRKDADSGIYVPLALSRAADEYRTHGDAARAKEARSFLASLSSKAGDYASITLAAYDLRAEGKDPFSAYAKALQSSAKERPDLVYILDEAAQSCTAKGNHAKAVELYTRILKEFPSYKRTGAVNYALASMTASGLSNGISRYYLDVIGKADPFLRDKAVSDLIQLFAKEKDPAKRIALAGALYPPASDVSAKLPASKEDAAVTALLDYVTGAAFAEKGDQTRASGYLAKALTKLRTTEILYYETNMLLASLASKKGDAAEEEKYLFSATTNYLNRWNRPDFTSAVMRQISYYESAGADLEYAGDYKKAADLYSRYVKLVGYLHWLKKYENLYGEYGARAHVLYIDAASSASGDMLAKLKELETQYSADKLDVARLNFDKAHIYGLAWIYAKTGIEYDRIQRNSTLAMSESSIAENFRKSQNQIDWALFMDDTFSDPYLLQGWINQYVDLRRDELAAKNRYRDMSQYDDLFPAYLWEKNKDIFQKALDTNDEVKSPDKEGSLHLNLANTHFLLGNYPAALEQYRLASKFKKNFGSKKEESLFRYHFGYCLWQNGDAAGAKREIRRVLDIYSTTGGQQRESAEQRCTLYRYLALFERSDRNYSEALAWYTRLINDSGKNKVAIDLPRTLIDMSWCYEQLGDDANAVSALNRAASLLEKASDNDPTFKLHWRPFGIFSFHWYNLGDSVVIGDSRIIGALTVVQEKLLVESSLEKIALKRGDYASARTHILKRIDLVKGRGSSFDADIRVRALNDDGYCLYMLGKYSEARARFNEALDISSENSDRKGMFISIQNLVDLSAFACENGLSFMKEPRKELSDFRAKIMKYKNDYETTSYEAEKKSIEAAAEKKKITVSQAALDAAKKKIAAEATVIYAALDLSVASVDFYLAEYLSTANPPADPFGAYQAQDRLFKAYSDAGSVFENANDGTIPQGKRALLFLNAAECRRKTGMYEKAYELLGRAETAAADSGRDDILWTVYRREAAFMRDCGKSIDENNLKTAERYFSLACAIVEKAPALYASKASAVVPMYTDRAALFARRGSMNDAFRMMERGYAVERVMATESDSPSFSGKSSTDYSGYRDLLHSVRVSIDNRAALLASGKKETDPELVTAGESLKKSFAVLNSFAKDLDPRNPLLASDLFIRDELPSKKEIGDASVYVFLCDGERSFAWRITSAKTETAVLAGSENTLCEAAAAFMNRDTTDSSRFVVFNDSAEKIFSLSRSSLPRFTFIPSVERVRYFTGHPKAGWGVSASVDTAAPKDLLSCDFLTGSDVDVVKKAFYSCSANPSCAAVLLSHASQARSVMEAMLWTDARSICFFTGSNPVKAKENLFSLGADFSSLNTSSVRTFAAGADARFVLDAASIDGMKTREKESAGAAFASGDAASALSRFSKYSAAAGGKLSADDEFLLARIYDLAGNQAAASVHANAASSDGSDAHLSYAVYCFLAAGDLTSASSLMEKSGGKRDAADFALYRTIVSCAKGAVVPSIVLPEGNTLVPRDKLSLLAFRYAVISGLRGVRADLSSPSSPADLCISGVSGSSASADQDSRAAEILSLYKDSSSKRYDKALSLVSAGGAYDQLSVYPLIGVLARDADRRFADNASFLRGINLSAAAASAPRLDRVIFLSLYARACAGGSLMDEYRSALALLDAELKLSGNAAARASVLLDRAGSFAAEARHKEASAFLKDSLVPSTTARFLLLSAECDIFTGNFNNGIERLNAFAPSDDAELARKEILLAHAQRLQILAKPAYAAEGIPQYESHMKKVISLLDPSLFISDNAPRRDLLDSGLDFLVSLSMKRGDTRSALLFVEIKQQTALWRLTAGSARPGLSKDALAAYTSSHNEKEYAAALSLYPDLSVGKRVLFPTVGAFQKRMPRDSAAVVIVRNEHDLFAWSISKEAVQPIRIPGGYDTAESIIAAYSSAVRDQSPVSVVSAGLEPLLRPVFRQLQGKDIYLVTDEYTEKIPFEISGPETMIGKSGRLSYLVSLSSSLGAVNEPSASCVLYGGTALDAAAIRESGIDRKDAAAGIVHFAGDMDDRSAGLSFGGRSAAGAVKGKELVWVGGQYPYDSQSLFVKDLSCSGRFAVILSGEGERDINTRFFASVLYERITAGDSLRTAFSFAMKRLSESQTYAHPAYWAGIKLYVQGFSEQ